MEHFIFNKATIDFGIVPIVSIAPHIDSLEHLLVAA